MKTLRNDIHIDASMEAVQNFGGDPNHWEDWYENLQHAKVIRGEGDKGTIVEFDYSFMGIHVPVKLEILENDEHHWVGKFTGGVNGEQIVNFEEEGQGTHVEMIYKYEMTNKLMNRFSNTRLMERMLRRSMVHTIENWKIMCEGMKH